MCSECSTQSACWCSTWEQAGGENDVPDPALAVDLRVEAAGAVTRYAARQGIQHDGGRVDGTMAMDIKHAEQRHDDDSYRERSDDWWLD